MAASIHMVVIKISIFRTSMYLRANSIGKKFSLCISRALTDTHNIFCLIHRIISTVNKQIRPAESLPCADKYIRVEEPACFRVIIPALQIIPARFIVVIISKHLWCFRSGTGSDTRYAPCL